MHIMWVVHSNRDRPSNRHGLLTTSDEYIGLGSRCPIRNNFDKAIVFGCNSPAILCL